MVRLLIGTRLVWALAGVLLLAGGSRAATGGIGAVYWADSVALLCAWWAWAVLA